MSRRLLAFLASSLVVLAVGCPPDKPPPPPGPGDGTPTDPNAPKPLSDGQATDPLEGSVFSKDELLEIYAAEASGDAARRDAALRKHRLIDAAGQEVPARVQAYERALQRLAAADPEGWSKTLESLR